MNKPDMTIRDYYAKKRGRKLNRQTRARDNMKLARAAGNEIKNTLLSRTALYKQLDHLCKLIAIRRDRKREAGYCLVCVAKRQLGFGHEVLRPITTPYHVMPRGDKAVRWDLRNIIGTCAACNWGELKSRSTAARKAKMRQIHSYILGEPVLLDLEALAKTTAKFSMADLLELRDRLKAILEGRAC